MEGLPPPPPDQLAHILLWSEIITRGKVFTAKHLVQLKSEWVSVRNNLAHIVWTLCLQTLQLPRSIVSESLRHFEALQFSLFFINT